MTIISSWKNILNVTHQAKKQNRYFSIATVDAKGNPHITPIGHVFFRDDCTAYYFDAYSKKMPENFKSNKRVCVMAVNSGTRFWLTSLFDGKFKSAPAVRLFGEVGEVRVAKPEELQELASSIKATKYLKGHQLLWSNLKYVRDIRFDDFSYAAYPVMCEAFLQS
jgi:predicted pyridoxine 5'-phosphate oxidase superfamily flavin-nucleotide-binding protein